MTVRLLLLAHGETAATRRAAFAADESLEPAALARICGPALRCDVALASPAAAARQTAQALGLDAVVDAALRDLDVGAWAGRTLADVAATSSAAAAAFLADPGFDDHGGESIEALVARAGALLDRHRAAGGRLVAVTHAAVVRAAVVACLGAPLSAFWRVDVAPLGGFALSSDGRRWSLRTRRLDP